MSSLRRPLSTTTGGQNGLQTQIERQFDKRGISRRKQPSRFSAPNCSPGKDPPICWRRLRERMLRIPISSLPETGRAGACLSAEQRSQDLQSAFDSLDFLTNRNFLPRIARQIFSFCVLCSSRLEWLSTRPCFVGCQSWSATASGRNLIWYA